jgi:phospholipid/cholesterol/gamma-HCH transport system substrate-binding protein
LSVHRNRFLELRVGLFVFTALVIFTVLIFTVGTRKQLFGAKVSYRAQFDSVGGLREGSPLTMAGVDVGTIGEVELRSDGKVHVVLRLNQDFVPLMRVDTVASIGNKGLLGDKLVDLTVGTGPPLPPGGLVRTSSGGDLAALTAQASAIMSESRATVENLRAATGVLADPAFQSDVRRATHDLGELLRLMVEGDGTVRRLLTDARLADDVQGTVASARLASAEVARAARSARAIVEEVQRGDGTAHELIYGQSGKQLLRNLAAATGETAQLLAAVRTGDGTLHDLIYEDEADGILENVEAMSADLRAIVGAIRRGEGTLGALLNDPSIYEDVKRLVGDLERNEILRALVRYSIRNDEARPQPVASPAAD